MHTKKILISLLVILGFTLPALAQREMSYPMLLKHSRQARVYYNYIVIPNKNTQKNEVLITFKIENDFLIFKRDVNVDSDNYTPGNRKFKANVNINVEVFKSDSSRVNKMRDGTEMIFKKSERKDHRDRRRDEHQKPGEQASQFSGKESIERAYWRGTAIADTYEETKSHKEYLQGAIKLNLKPGFYRAALQLSQTDNGGNAHHAFEMIHVPDYNQKDASQIIMLDRVKNFSDNAKLPLLNFGRNVYYGKDFGILFRLPENADPSNYKVEVYNLGTNSEDTSAKKVVFSKEIEADHVAKNVRLQPDTTKKDLYLDLKKGSSPFNFAFANIPNSRFANDTYRIKVLDTKTNKVLAFRNFQSRWLNMPTSLLNLHVAIHMLRFMVSKKELKKLESGSYKEREKKFKEFWKKRDPTPKTQYNELMAEYYRRIDYAWEHFSTLNKPGYDTDIGKVYIKMGPPDSVERRYPPGQPGIIIWKYGKRKFIFQATSGFGDYELVK